MIKEISVDSENHCQFKCLKEERCQSYNFVTLENEAGGFVCQLSNSDRFRSLDNYSQDGDFKYGGLKVVFEDKFWVQPTIHYPLKLSKDKCLILP